MSESELLIVSAGGKANIKLWKVLLNDESEKMTINKIVHLYEFKRIKTNTKINSTNDQKSNEKPWLYVDLISNPDVRFMDVVLIKSETSNTEEIFMCFVCSDGCLRQNMI